ncbi:hypothetical protein M9458_026957, partial [Cirrhinus mrigala]
MSVDAVCDHETLETEKNSQALINDNEKLCESTRKRKEQNDDPVEQTLPSLSNCDKDTKGITYRETPDINDASVKTEPGNGEKALESNSPDAKLGKMTCESTEMSGTNLNVSGNDTPSTDVDMRPESPACKESQLNNSSVCPSLEEPGSSAGPMVEPEPPAPIPEAVDNIKNESEETPMETDDIEGQNSGAEALVPENVVQDDPESEPIQTP